MSAPKMSRDDDKARCTIEEWAQLEALEQRATELIQEERQLNMEAAGAESVLSQLRHQQWCNRQEQFALEIDIHATIFSNEKLRLIWLRMLRDIRGS